MKKHGKIPDLSIEELREIVAPIAERTNITGVSIFGSRARGDYDSDSDYDLLIDVNENYRFRDYLCFKEYVSKMLECDVDVITRRSLMDDQFARDIIREAVNVY